MLKALMCLALCFAPLTASAADPQIETKPTMVFMQTDDSDDNVTAPADVETQVNYDELDVGIRDVVRWLRELSFETTDSGDGVSKPLDQRVFDGPHVIMVVEPTSLIDEAHRLTEWLEGYGVEIERSGVGPVSVEASYDPVSKVAVLMLFGLCDTSFNDARRREVERAKRDVNQVLRVLAENDATTKVEPS